MTEVLTISGVRKSYPGTPPVLVLADVSLEIHRGERTAVIGPSCKASPMPGPPWSW